MGNFDKYKKELAQTGLSTYDDLLKQLQPLILNATQIVALKSIGCPLPDVRFLSHFGGYPYFEQDEQWPLSESGQPLDFIFQIVNEGNINLPDEIKILQFYYDWDEMPWETGDKGWLVKTYKEIDESKSIIIEPHNADDKTFCEIDFKQIKSLPDWESISNYNDNASKLSCILNEDEPWGNYDKAVTELIGEQDFKSQLGGYAKWIQGDETPTLPNGKNARLLFQIDSEDNAGLMWGDTGLIYVFYNPETLTPFMFSLQCF